MSPKEIAIILLFLGCIVFMCIAGYEVRKHKRNNLAPDELFLKDNEDRWNETPKDYWLYQGLSIVFFLILWYVVFTT